MVEATQTRADRQPVAEIANRAATAGAALAAAAKAVALSDHKRMLDDHASRVRHSFRAGLAKLGYEVPPAAEDDMAGDVFVCGDITTQLAPEPVPQMTPAPVPVQSPPVSTTQTPPASTSKVWPYVLAAALGSGGLGAGVTAAINTWTSRTEPPSVGQPAPDTQWELRISSGEEGKK